MPMYVHVLVHAHRPCFHVEARGQFLGVKFFLSTLLIQACLVSAAILGTPKLAGPPHSGRFSCLCSHFFIEMVRLQLLATSGF